MAGLTAQQAAIVRFFRDLAEDGGGPPTLREVCTHFGWSSTGTARDHLRALVRKGVLRRSGPQARCSALPPPPVAAAAVPVLGRVPAGQPLLAEENHLGEATVPRSWLSPQGSFAVGVTGDSMTGVGIVDGDLIVARASDTARDGDIVVARCGDAATVKRFERRAGRARLMPENPAHEPVIVDEDTRIVGVAVGLMRDLRRRKLGEEVKHG